MAKLFKKLVNEMNTGRQERIRTRIGTLSGEMALQEVRQALM